MSEQEQRRGPHGHFYTAYLGAGEVDVDVSHTCPVCHSGPIPTFDADGTIEHRICADLGRWVCLAACWPKLEALGYLS